MLKRGQVDDYRGDILAVDLDAEALEAYDVALGALVAARHAEDELAATLWAGRTEAAHRFHERAALTLASDACWLLTIADGQLERESGLAAELNAQYVFPGFLRRLWRQTLTSASARTNNGVEEFASWVEKAAYAAEAAAHALGDPALELAAACQELSDAVAPLRASLMAQRVLCGSLHESARPLVLPHLCEVEDALREAFRSELPDLLARVKDAERATITPPEGRTIEAGGGVVWRRAANSLEVLLVHRFNRDGWSLPKGKCLMGETAESCAMREVLEETGIECILGDELLDVRYRDRNGRLKHTRYWAMQPRECQAGAIVLGNTVSEVDAVRWASFGEAMGLLVKQRDREVLASLPSAGQVDA